MLQQQVLLKHVADVPRLAGDLGAGQIHTAGVRPDKAGQDIQQGGFPGSAQTQQGNQFSLLKMHTDIPKNHPPGIGFTDIFGSEQFHPSHSPER